MKIRTGFVSNSSSSSFVVAFPRIPHSVEEVQEMLFGKEEFYYVDHSSSGPNNSITARRAAESVFDKIMEQGAPASIKHMVEQVASGTLFESEWTKGLDTFEIYRKFDDDKGDTDYEKGNKAVEKEATILVRNFVKDQRGKYFFLFHYADEDGPFGGTMEHGGLFEKLPNMTISNH
jgi:hypothetical protein